MACLCAGTGFYRVSIYMAGERFIVNRPCDCDAAYGVRRQPTRPAPASKPSTSPQPRLDPSFPFFSKPHDETVEIGGRP